MMMQMAKCLIYWDEKQPQDACTSQEPFIVLTEEVYDKLYVNVGPLYRFSRQALFEQGVQHIVLPIVRAGDHPLDWVTRQEDSE